MNIIQKEITLTPKKRGFHLVTNEILSAIDISNITLGTINIFLKHTSASLSINENCEMEVREDMENLFNEICDDRPYYTHTYEGDDDMPAHAKASLLGCSLTIPITNGRLNLGTWQGIYLGEHRYHGGSRKVVITIMGVDL
jgi:secondary thiamine-phosphate synthase enzyme